MNDAPSTDEVNQLEEVSSLSNSLSSIAWSNDDIQATDTNSDGANSQDEVPAPMIRPPLPPPLSFVPSAPVAPPPPTVQITTHHHSPVKSNEIIVPADEEKPPKPPPPSKPFKLSPELKDRTCESITSLFLSLLFLSFLLHALSLKSNLIST